eukprot:1725209-Rhodomonas_salina.2
MGGGGRGRRQPAKEREEICALRRNAAVRKECSSGHMGCGDVNHGGSAVRTGSGLLVPSVAKSAVLRDWKQFVCTCKAREGTRWVCRVR